MSKKKFLIALGIVVSFLVCIAIIRDPIIKSVLTAVVSKRIEARVHMDGLSLNIFSSTLRISGFKIYNPSGFPEGTLVFCPKINVIYDRATLFKSKEKRHFKLMEIELKEMELSKNKEGKINVDSLKIGRVPMQIDLLVLSIGKIIYKDYTNGTEPSVQVYDVNNHKIYKSITGKQLFLLLLAEPMKGVAIKMAGIYGVAKSTGVSVLRTAVGATFIGKDNVQEVIDASFEHVYEVSLEVVKRMGTITKDDAPNGAIKANINGAMIALQLRKTTSNAVEITISARKYMFPKLDIAGGVLYQILDKLQSL